MTDEKIARINALAKKAKTEGLTDAEKKEQQELRAEYVADFRKSLKAQLDHTVVINPDGSSYKLKQDKSDAAARTRGTRHPAIRACRI